MPSVRHFLITAAAIVASQSPMVAQEPVKDKDEVLTRPLDDRRDLTLLRRVTETTFLHEAARVSYTVPDGWKEIRPHRLNRKIDPRISTILGIERADRELVGSLYWIPMNPDQRLSQWVRETASGSPAEYGEEYETLKTIYGKDHVTIPARFRSGPFDVYRINITGGPDRGDKYDGVLFVFAVDSGGSTWLIKARLSFPKGDRTRNEAWAMEVLQGFKQLADSAGSTKRTGEPGGDSDKR
jgi:hypothetical protein